MTPLIETYRAMTLDYLTNIARKVAARAKYPMDLTVASLMIALSMQSIKVAKKYNFTESALLFQRAMMVEQATKWKTIQMDDFYPDGPLWIWSDDAYIDGQSSQASAFYIRNIYHPLVKATLPRHIKQILDDRDIVEAMEQESEALPAWIVDILDGHAETRFAFQIEQNGNFSFGDKHVCPWETCDPNDPEPCLSCKNYLLFWGVWLIVALMMIKGQFATTPEPSEFPERTEQVRRRVESDNPKKKKYEQEDFTYRIVNFDACLKKPAIHDDHDQRGATSWVEQAKEIDPDAVVYVDKNIASFPRQLRSPYFVNKQGQTIDVKSHEKRIPVKLRDVITRVVASKIKKGDIK